VYSHATLHDKFTVFSYNTAILKVNNDNTNTPVTKLHIFCDGAGSQFKNGFTLTKVSAILQPTKIHPKLEFFDWRCLLHHMGRGQLLVFGGTVWRRILQKK
jgi:hypothetical protein